MAQRKQNTEKEVPLSRGTETGVAPERPPIPDPLGDDRRVVASGALTSDEPGRQGLLRSGSMPLEDGGNENHPVHDDGMDDLDPDDYEELFDEAQLEPRAKDAADVAFPEQPENASPALDRSDDAEEEQEDADEEETA